MRPLSLSEQMRNQFRYLPDSTFKDLESLVDQLVTKLIPKRTKVELIWFDRNRTTVTLSTRTEEIEVRLDDPTVSPRRRVREFITPHTGNVYDRSDYCEGSSRAIPNRVRV